MWKPILGIYVAGLAVTAVALLRTQMFKHDRLMNAVSITLWPVYWSLYGWTLFLNRRRN
ncbi:MAG TPA: hypothetical protein VE981_12015 [Planctomycetota bacterium]|nr:hypothetical protein [Planctomycetota bacterium]